MPEQFRGGPLEDGSESQIHSLIVHMNGDGRHSIGYYRQVYSGDAGTGYFEWVPDTLYEDLADIAEKGH